MPKDLLQVHEPPTAASSLLGTGGRLGPHPEDFQVDEVPLYPAAGSGDHWYVRIRKRGLTTRDAIEAVARASGMPASEIGSAGMKDKHAVTTQWLSAPARASAPDSWQLDSGLELVEWSRHTNKLRTGHAKGNHFRIRLHGVEAPERASAIAAEINRTGLVNYFGAQRFGHGGTNLRRALEWADRKGRGSRFHRKLWSSVLQSEIFNRYATARADRGVDRLLLGDVVRLDGSRSLFAVTDPDAELSRMIERDIHLTGPIIGPKMRAASGEPAEMEARAASFLTSEQLAILARFADGTRRDLLVWPEKLSVEIAADALVLSFYLPSGSYATEVVRAFCRSEFLEGGRDATHSDPERDTRRTHTEE